MRESVFPLLVSSGAWRGVLMLLAVMGGYVLLRVLWRFALVPVARKTPTGLDLALLEAAEKPVRILYWAAALCLAARPLADALPSSWALAGRLAVELGYAFTVLSVLWVAFALSKGFGEWYSGRAVSGADAAGRRNFVAVSRRFVNLTVLFLALLVVLDHYEVRVSALMGAAGIASIAVALAAQETLANVIAGVAILADRPFRVGDRVELADGRIGDVKDVGLRSTKILSFDATLLIIPNSEIVKAPVTNHSYPDSRVKIRHTVGVAYGSDLGAVKALLLEILGKDGNVLDDPPPSVYFTEFADSSLNLLLVFWIRDYKDRLAVLDGVNMEINRRFAEAGIEIPFPQRDVWMRRA